MSTKYIDVSSIFHPIDLVCPPQVPPKDYTLCRFTECPVYRPAGIVGNGRLTATSVITEVNVRKLAPRGFGARETE
jgi:hypothetical protein